MKKRWRPVVAAWLVIVLVLLGGCSFDYRSLTGKKEKTQPPQLMKVEIRFTDGVTLTGYVKELAVSEEGVVYVGGASANYLYDARGKVIGVFNYNQVLYMKIIE